MILKVNRDELYNVTNVMKKDADVYFSEIEKMEKAIETLKTIWQGEDARVFCENLTNFINKMKGIPTTLETLSNFCDTSNKGFTEADEQFGNAVKAENLKEEEEPING